MFCKSLSRESQFASTRREKKKGLTNFALFFSVHAKNDEVFIFWQLLNNEMTSFKNKLNSRSKVF